YFIAYLHAASLDRFQKVKNSLARVVVSSVKRNHHITPILRMLHWLPIQKRIQFKIASLIYKSLLHRQPPYLLKLIIPYIPTRNLRLVEKSLLTIPNIVLLTAVA